MNTNHPTDDVAREAAIFQFDDASLDGEAALMSTQLPLPRRAGKVRDVYDLGGDRMLMVSTDRISAFDYVLPSGIPGKGRLLTAMSKFWFDHLDVPHHLLGTEVPQELAAKYDVQPLVGRVMVVKKGQSRSVRVRCQGLSGRKRMA